MANLLERLRNWQNRNTPEGLTQRIDKLNQGIEYYEQSLQEMQEHPGLGITVGLVQDEIQRMQRKEANLEVKLNPQTRRGNRLTKDFLASLARAIILGLGALGIPISIVAQKDKSFILPAVLIYFLAAGISFIMLALTKEKIYLMGILFLIVGLLAFGHI